MSTRMTKSTGTSENIGLTRTDGFARNTLPDFRQLSCAGLGSSFAGIPAPTVYNPHNPLRACHVPAGNSRTFRVPLTHNRATKGAELAERFFQHTLPNGLTLLAEEMPGVQSAAMTLLVP